MLLSDVCLSRIISVRCCCSVHWICADQQRTGICLDSHTSAPRVGPAVCVTALPRRAAPGCLVRKCRAACVNVGL